MPPKRRPRKKSEKKLKQKQKQKQKQNQNVRINITGGGSGGGGTVYIPPTPQAIQMPAGFMNTRDNGRIESLLKTIEKRLTLVPATTMEPVFQNANTNLSLADLESRVEKPFFDATDGDSKTDPNIPIERVFNAPIKNNTPLREVAAVPNMTDDELVKRYMDSLVKENRNIRPKEDPRNLDNIINPTAIPQGEQSQENVTLPAQIEIVAEPEAPKKQRKPRKKKEDKGSKSRLVIQPNTEEEEEAMNIEQPQQRMFNPAQIRQTSPKMEPSFESSSSSDIQFA
jgi:hypothetical protein